MKNPHEDHGIGAGSQLELVVVPGDADDKLKKATLANLHLFGSKPISIERLKTLTLAEVQDMDFTEEEQAAICQEYKIKKVASVIGNLKSSGTRAIQAYANQLEFRGSHEPLKKLAQDAMITVGDDDCRRLIYANRVDIRDAVQHLENKKERQNEQWTQRIKDFKALEQDMIDQQLEFAGKLFRDA